MSWRSQIYQIIKKSYIQIYLGIIIVEKVLQFTVKHSVSFILLENIKKEM
jgi:hypothetical protein